jgi:hypothetical protein
MQRRMVRSRLWLVGLLVAALAAGGALVARGGDEQPAPRRTQARPKPPPLPPDQRFKSRPDLSPPAIEVATQRPGTSPGLVFLAPKRRSGPGGPAIVDERGRLLWFKPTKKPIVADDLRVQRYRGKPVLTWWEGKTNPNGYGQGSWVLMDASYEEIARVRAGNGLQGDLHDMQLTPRGTALITIYERVPTDLSVIGSPRGGHAMDSVIQEVDVRSGRVVWEWRSMDHVELWESQSVAPKTLKLPYDYFHINSIEEDTDGDLLVSARNTWAIYKIDRPSGEVVWRLGGIRSDFALEPGLRFAWQHDARRMPDGTITLFDNQATPRVGDESRALVLEVDERRRTARVVRELAHPQQGLAIAEGNAQMLPGGAMLVGWGIGRHRGLSEFGPDGDLRFDLKLPRDTDTYRAFRFPWTGQPAEPPVAVAERDGGEVRAYASWNGATEVTRWELLAGDDPDALRSVATAERTGFETEITAATSAPYVAVRALAGDRELATSSAIRPR